MMLAAGTVGYGTPVERLNRMGRSFVTLQV
jgi:hypothetical protein